MSCAWSSNCWIRSSCTIVAVVASLSIGAAPAQAQVANGYRPPVVSKGFQMMMMEMEYLQHQARYQQAAASLPQYRVVRAEPSTEQALNEPLMVVVTVRPDLTSPRGTTPAQTEYADIRGPDGSVRSFRLEGGRAAIHSQTIVVRAGESVTLHLNRTAQR